MRLELKEFAKAARSMHQQPGGIKRTRLMLHLRPYQSRKVFIVKATDGRTTLTTRVEHQGQIKTVEALLADFVSECTKASVPQIGATAVGQAQSPPSPTSTAPAAASPPSPQKDSGAAGGNKAAQQSGHGTSAASPAQQQHHQKQQQPKPTAQQSKGKKGKRH